MSTPLVEVFGNVLDWPRAIRASLRSLLDDIEAAEAAATAALDAHLAEPTDAHDASAISYDNSAPGSLVADDVQEAIEELRTEAPAALAAHVAAADPHTGYLKESEVSATPGNDKVSRANASGKLAAGWGGSASTLATLNGSSLVVENPANATATPTASKIPIAAGDGTLTAWIDQATESLAGKAEIGTLAEIVTGTDDSRVVSLLKLATNTYWWAGIERPGTQFDWTRPSAAAITATPKLDADGGTGIGAWIPCQATDGTTRMVNVTGALTCTITTSGAAGLHATYSEAASTGYWLYLIWGSSPGANLIMVPSGTADGWALPSTYTHVSRMLFFAANDGSSNLLAFTQTGDFIIWAAPQAVLSGGTATSATTATTGAVAPSASPRSWKYQGRLEPVNAQATARTLTVAHGAIGIVFHLGIYSSAEDVASFEFISASNIRYSWSGTVTTGATISVVGWFIGGG